MGLRDNFNDLGGSDSRLGVEKVGVGLVNGPVGLGPVSYPLSCGMGQGNKVAQEKFFSA